MPREERQISQSFSHVIVVFQVLKRLVTSFSGLDRDGPFTKLMHLLLLFLLQLVVLPTTVVPVSLFVVVGVINLFYESKLKLQSSVGQNGNDDIISVPK